MKKFYWSAVCHEERIKAISVITDIINNYSTITNFQRFSDIALSMVLEMDDGELTRLYKELEGLMQMEGKEIGYSPTGSECIILLNITFSKGTGDLQIGVPGINE